MTTIKFEVPNYDKRILGTLYEAKNEIITLTGCSPETNLNELCDSEIKKAELFYEGRLPKLAIENGNFPHEYYARLFQLRRILNSMNFYYFLKTFTHRREHISTNYMSKRMNIPVDVLEVWLKLESIELMKKKHGKFIDCIDAMNFMQKISEKKYELKILLKQ